MNGKLFFVVLSALTLALALPAHEAYGWGQYGHEQINDAAVDLLGASSGLGKCFDQARYVVKRLAISPDLEWKTDVLLKNLSAADKAKREDDNRYEHPLHFDEVDAWVPNPKPGDIERLPAGEYKDVFSFYSEKLRENAKYVQTVDPAKKLKDPDHPTVNEVTDHGTAPWRAQQLYRLGVDALKKGDVKAAVLYLGAMGHYVADMSQPFHATLNYDGDYSPRPAAGIHHEIDTGVMPLVKKDSSDVFSSFDQTDASVLDAARRSLSASGSAPLNDDQIVAGILKQVDSGTGDVGSFLKTYADLCAQAETGAGSGALDLNRIRKRMGPQKRPRAGTTAPKESSSEVFQGNPDHGATPTRTDGAFCEATPPRAGGRAPEVRPLPKALEAQLSSQLLSEIETRLGDGAATLSRIWAAAYEAAGRPQLSGCAELQFDQSYVIQNYPRPDDDSAYGYMPAGYNATQTTQSN